jgi:hypothetical protein
MSSCIVECRPDDRLNDESNPFTNKSHPISLISTGGHSLRGSLLQILGGSDPGIASYLHSWIDSLCPHRDTRHVGSGRSSCSPIPKMTRGLNRPRRLAPYREIALAKCYEVRLAAIGAGNTGPWQPGGLFTNSRAMIVKKTGTFHTLTYFPDTLSSRTVAK